MTKNYYSVRTEGKKITAIGFFHEYQKKAAEDVIRLKEYADPYNFGYLYYLMELDQSEVKNKSTEEIHKLLEDQLITLSFSNKEDLEICKKQLFDKENGTTK